MRKLYVHTKSGFKALSDLYIYDRRKDRFEKFYNCSAGNYFNLPVGVYYYVGNIGKLRKPISYQLPDLPKPDKGKHFPKQLKISKKRNPNKCSINRHTGDVSLDHSLTRLPKYRLVHILFHEIAHYFYKEPNDPLRESKCDIFATRYMLERGYNPSQCLEAVNLNLTNEGSEERKVNHYNYLTYGQW